MHSPRPATHTRHFAVTPARFLRRASSPNTLIASVVMGSAAGRGIADVDPVALVEPQRLKGVSGAVNSNANKPPFKYRTSK